MKSQELAEIVLQSVTMRDVCNRYGIRVNSANKAICPFHSDKRPSMHVYDGQRGYYCFVCGAGGDVINFARRFFQTGFIGAVKKLNDDFQLGLTVDDRNKHKLTGQERAALQQAERRRKQEEAYDRELSRLTEAYNEALDVWTALDTCKRKEAPKTALDAPSDSFLYACAHIDEAEYQLSCAELALQRFRLNGKNERR